jgi:hypothetical protein
MNFETHCIYVLVRVSQQIMLVFLNIINPLVFIMDKGCTVCEVGAEFIHMIHIIVSRQSDNNKEGTLNRKQI